MSVALKGNSCERSPGPPGLRLTFPAGRRFTPPQGQARALRCDTLSTETLFFEGFLKIVVFN